MIGYNITLYVSLLLKVDTMYTAISQSVIAESVITFREAGRRSQVLKARQIIREDIITHFSNFFCCFLFSY